MSGFLLDTHIWLWFMTGSRRLTRALAELIASRDEAVWLSPISIWELGLLHERGRIRLQQPLREWVANALSHRPLREAPLTTEVALRSAEIELPLRDPADRFLAATALVFDLTLLTADRRLTRARGIPTRSR